MAKKHAVYKESKSLYYKITQIIEEARNCVYRTANFTMVQAYWNIGRMIVEEEQNGEDRAEYGKALLKSLSKRFTVELGKGFTVSNLQYMRQFYGLFPKYHALRGELTWTHYRLPLKVEKDIARTYYMSEAADNRWSTRTLERQINNLFYARILSSDSKHKPALEQEAEDNKVELQPIDVIKSP